MGFDMKQEDISIYHLNVNYKLMCCVGFQYIEH